VATFGWVACGLTEGMNFGLRTALLRCSKRRSRVPAFKCVDRGGAAGMSGPCFAGF